MRRHLLTVGLVFAVPALIILLVGWFWGRANEVTAIGLAVSPAALVWVAIACGVVLVAWLVALYLAHAHTRPITDDRRTLVLTRGVVGLSALLIAFPLCTAGYYALVQRDLVSSVAPDERSAISPFGMGHRAAADRPWGDRRRINIVLLGGDGDVGREGIRTDSVILASIDVRTGRTTTFSLPRNLVNVPFPRGSALARAYPRGFRAPGDSGESMLNAIYRNLPFAHPHILGKTDNEGADAVKLGVSGALGVPVDYYVLVNLRGFKRIVDAIGGITVNINRPIPINGDTDRGIPPTGYIHPGPHRRLDGFHALWYARGRWGLTDYDRMERQRCALNAIVAEADPVNLMLRYTRLAKASKDIMRTDIPQKQLPPLARLTLKIKAHPLKSVVFKRSNRFDPNYPDYRYVHRVVRRALAQPAPQTGPPGKSSRRHHRARGTVDDTASACAYHPVSGS